MPEIFSEAPSHRFNRIAKYSPYSKLPQYELVTLIVKSNDNLKQEQFAMQLLQMFKDIFQA
jgi:phosphatidylinositol kinase/protein kinase (PI-3  family)